MDNETLNYKFENFEIVAIPDFPNYFISIDGDVYSDKWKKIKKMKPFINKKGYLRVHLFVNKKRYEMKNHTLVAKTFLYNIYNKDQVDHIDGNKTNNHVDNLRFCTNSENQKNCCKRITNKSGILGVYLKNDNRWVAKWTDFNANSKTKSFSIKKYGEQEAKQLAINLRKEMEKKYYPTKERFDD